VRKNAANLLPACSQRTSGAMGGRCHAQKPNVPDHTRELEERGQALAQSASHRRRRSTRTTGTGLPPLARGAQPARRTACVRGRGLCSGAELRRRRAQAPPADTTHSERVVWFLENACPDHHVRGGPAHLRARHTAMRILQRYPEVAKDSLSTSIVCGDLAEVERALARRPQAASEQSSAPSPARAGVGGSGDLDRDLGPKGWEPLLYLCFTRLPLAAANDNAGGDPRARLCAGPRATALCWWAGR